MTPGHAAHPIIRQQKEKSVLSRKVAGSGVTDSKYRRNRWRIQGEGNSPKSPPDLAKICPAPRPCFAIINVVLNTFIHIQQITNMINISVTWFQRDLERMDEEGLRVLQQVLVRQPGILFDLMGGGSVCLWQ